MPADIQMIAVVMTVSSTPMNDISPPAARMDKVRMMKKVCAAFPAVRYVFFGILCGLKRKKTVYLKTI